MKRVTETAGENSIVVITADHGHVDVGGHGGTADVVMKIPFIVYKKNSNLRVNQVSQITNLDVAPSLAALLGIPVPRHAEGVFVESILNLFDENSTEKHLQDLYKQKQYYVRNFLEFSGLGKKNVKGK